MLFNLANQYAVNEMFTEALNTYNVIVKNKMFSNAGRFYYFTAVEHCGNLMSAANITSYSILFRFHCTITQAIFSRSEALQDDDRTRKVDRLPRRETSSLGEKGRQYLKWGHCMKRRWMIQAR